MPSLLIVPNLVQRTSKGYGTIRDNVYMDVLHLYAGNRFGGIEVLLLLLMRRYKMYSPVPPRFALSFDELLANKLRDENASIDVFGNASFMKPTSILRARHNIRNQLLKRPPDIAICHEFWTYAIAAPVIRELNIPLGVWHHSPGSGYWLQRAIRLTPPDLAIACSDYVASTLHQLEAPDRIRVFHAPVEPPPTEAIHNRDQIRANFGATNHDAVILHVARISELKGQYELLQAIRLVRDLKVKLWIVGASQTAYDENYLNTLKAFTVNHKLDDCVSFLGHRDNVRELYSAADLYCQPNRFAESYGFTLIEALYAGLPVIASKIGGAQEILYDAKKNESYGILTRPTDYEDVARALRKLIVDDECRKRFQVLGPQRAYELANPETTFTELPKIYSDLLYHAARGAPLVP